MDTTNQAHKAAAWAAANLLAAKFEDALVYANTTWHGYAYCEEEGWPTVSVGDWAVVDFVRGYEGGVLVQVTGPDGACHEDEAAANYGALADLAMALLDAALADEDEQ